MSSTRIEQLKSFLEQDPDDTFTRFALALEYLKTDSSTEAEEIFTDIVKNDPDYSGVYYHLGKLYQNTGRYEEALRIFTDGLAVCSKKRELHAMNELRQATDELLDEHGDEF